ncbi:NAD(P)H-dependent oxidoreductase [Rhodococcus sp. P1Y]|uniref:NAD(P)H-dependent oxidoreductase n=1 Tax=Rhodococcus sp. P1Y TaxID=1302308 RepID=UPI000EB00D03|nr:NAD(P)H-dependent oxidoreductase [Rhodococcus sp. P1Y]AYJ47652.1 flavodoxin family protein [Rhodococcus sp. P1Y]
MSSLVVVSHSDPNSLTQHIAHATVDAIAATGGGVELADLTAENFDPRFSQADLDQYRRTGILPADVKAEQDRVDRADQLILVFPMYWWSMPALLKGWIDRVFINGWAFDLTPDNAFTTKLDRLTVHLVAVAADDNSSFERHGIHDAFRIQIERGIVEYVGATVGSTTFVHESESKSRDALASEVRELADALAQKVSGLQTVDA